MFAMEKVTAHDYECGSSAIVVTSKPLELSSPSAPGAIAPLGMSLKSEFDYMVVPPIVAI